ncbi:MAG: methyltransferase domain-containing protein [Alphaproteobacteria bacterium]|nr:methyltransferase domain-containing protein [Alphaproteobacteria bacterium]
MQPDNDPAYRFGPDLYCGWRESGLGDITEALEDRLLFNLIGNVEGQRVLEVGCGEGHFAIGLAQRGALVTGSDPSADMIESAHTTVNASESHFDLVRSSGERLPFAAASFDIVVAKTVLCFVGDAQDMISEMARVLRPNGRFVIGELHKWSSWAAQRRIRAWLGSPLWRRGRFRTATELKQLARNAGLEVETVRGAIYYPRLTTAARLLAPYDAWLGRHTLFGAAFIALSARKHEIA